MRAPQLAAFGLLTASACGPGSAQLAERERCYDAAEAEAQRRIDAVCPGPFPSCDAAGVIVEELRLSQERCP
jgi:hypothetical protein